MKVLMINKFLYMRGGSETYNFALAEALNKKGHQVVFFAMDDEKNIDSNQSKYFVPNVDYNGKSGFSAKINYVRNFFYSKVAAENMEALIRAERPDIAHIGLIHRQITFSVIDILKKYNIPIVMTVHDLIFACPNYTMLTNGSVCEDCVDGSVFNCVKKKCVKNSTIKSLLAAYEKIFLLKRKYYDMIDLYITECDFYKKIMKRSKITNSKIIFRTNFLPASQDYKFNEKYNDYILYFGRFSKEKGILTLLKAHKENQCKYRMVIIGAGPMKGDIIKFISENNLTNIELPGPIYGYKMERIIEYAKVVVTPSEWYENCPYALLQSIAKGKVEIVSRIGGLPELVDDGRTGYLFEPGNELDLAEKINTVMNMSKEEYESMSKRICKEAKLKHSWEEYTDQMIHEYSNLININKKK